MKIWAVALVSAGVLAACEGAKSAGDAATANSVDAAGPADAVSPADAPAAVPDQAASADAPAPDAGADEAADQAAADMAASDADAAPLPDAATAPYPASLKMGLASWTMQPKEETTRCILKRLDNDVPVWVHEISSKLAKGSHHLIVYRSDATEEQLEPKKCTPFTETLSGGNIPLMITEVLEEKLTLPAGVAFKFAPHQMIRIEAHYLNYYKDPINTGADITFLTLPPKEVANEADMLFYGTPDFSIKAGQKYTTPWNFIDVWPGTQVFAATGHTHQYGTNVEIALAQGNTATDPPLIYPPKDEPFDWAEAPMGHYDPPLQFKAGDGFQYRCTWVNTSNKNVGFGESANAEMCFFWAYYYPSKGYRMCINPGKWKNQAPDLITDPICCPDSPVCGLIKSYLSSGAFGG